MARPLESNQTFNATVGAGGTDQEATLFEHFIVLTEQAVYGPKIQRPVITSGSLSALIVSGLLLLWFVSIMLISLRTFLAPLLLIGFVQVMVLLAGFFERQDSRLRGDKLLKTGIRIRSNGMSFEEHTLSAERAVFEIAWQDLTALRLKQGFLFGLPVADAQFHLKDGRIIAVPASHMGSRESGAQALDFVRRFAPHAYVDSNIINVLSSQRAFTFTNLWLESLAGPPHRDKLLPLQQHSALQNGQYKIERLLARGGQATAYIATAGQASPDSDNKVVLKEYVLPLYVDNEARAGAVATFEKEARVLKELNHNGIGRLIDCFVEDQRAYLVLEYIRGQTLKEKVIATGPLNEDSVIDLILQMCDILQYLHSRKPPIVHRDFTPDNLVLESDGTLKLIDFMIAESLETSLVQTVAGKYAFMPIEQLRGHATTQSDLYALGCVIYYLLTGGEPEPLAQCSPLSARAPVSEKLNEVVMSLTQIDPADRPHSVEVVKQALL